MLTLNRCTGKSDYSLCDKTNWYGFYSKPISEDTRCEYCRLHMKKLGLDNELYCITRNGRIDCDSIDDMRLSGISYKDFDISILSPDEKVPFLVHPENANARRHGVLTVEMPETQDYVVRIVPKNKNFGNTYYTFEMKVGNRNVVINNGNTIYYGGKTTVCGFRTGTNESFKFVANTSANGPVVNDNSNIITLNIIKYKREQKSVFALYNQNIKAYSSRRLSSSRGLIGGRTESGNRYVSNVDTRPTNDRFIPEETITVTIQLIHVPGDRYQSFIVPNLDDMYKDLAAKHINDLERQKQYLVNLEQTTVKAQEPDSRCRCGMRHSKTDYTTTPINSPSNNLPEEPMPCPPVFMPPPSALPSPAPAPPNNLPVEPMPCPPVFVPALPNPAPAPSLPSPALPVPAPAPAPVPETAHKKIELENPIEESSNVQKEDEEWSILVDKINSLV